MNHVAVIGGGASGMMAALTAAADKDNRVLLLERQQRLGRKLLSTGNGRCNLTNLNASPAHYHGEDAAFAAPVLKRLPPEAVLHFFHTLGLVTVTEPDGRVYPLSDAANSVLDVLRFALEQRGVELLTGCPVREIRQAGQGYRLLTDEAVIPAAQVIVACGGAAGARLGGVMDGYQLLSKLGHERTRLYPALTPLLTDPAYPRSLKGVRADGAARLVLGRRLLAQSQGDIQFTDRGVSGPAIFDLSRAASTAEGELSLHLDFLRKIRGPQAEELLRARRDTLPSLPVSELFTGMVHNRLGRMLVKYSGLDAAAALSSLTEAELRHAAEACKDFVLPVRGAEGFDSAQVTAGGVRTKGFDPETLESLRRGGLFACGEVLDVDGDCGGYNLQWAWASGYVAGRLGR